MNKFLDILSLSLVLLLVPVESFANTFGSATFYNSYFEGRKTASGDIYRGYRNTCASNKYRLGTRLKVTNIENNKSVIVSVNDRGNFSHRNVDLSLRAFETISKRSKGRIKVKIEVINGR